MQTLKQRLEIVAKQFNRDMPFGFHLQSISHAVISKMKELGKYDEVKKKNEPMHVNNYPNSVVPVIDSIITEYFNNPNKFRKLIYDKSARRKQRFFNYDIEEYKMNAFEDALKECEIPVRKNYVKKGIAQYVLPAENPVLLIRLGKKFSKYRTIEIKKLRREKAAS